MNGMLKIKESCVPSALSEFLLPVPCGLAGFVLFPAAW